MEFLGIQGSLKPENAEGAREKEKKNDPRYYDQRDALKGKTRCVVGGEGGCGRDGVSRVGLQHGSGKASINNEIISAKRSHLQEKVFR